MCVCSVYVGVRKREGGSYLRDASKTNLTLNLLLRKMARTDLLFLFTFTFTTVSLSGELWGSVLYTNIDQTLPNKLHGPMHCKIGDT